MKSIIELPIMWCARAKLFAAPSFPEISSLGHGRDIWQHGVGTKLPEEINVELPDVWREVSRVTLASLPLKHDWSSSMDLRQNNLCDDDQTCANEGWYEEGRTLRACNASLSKWSTVPAAMLDVLSVICVMGSRHGSPRAWWARGTSRA